MYTVYYDKNEYYSDKSSFFVKIHKGDENGNGGCGYIKKDDAAVKEHSGKRECSNTLIDACKFIEDDLKIQLSSRFFCKHCFG